MDPKPETPELPIDAFRSVLGTKPLPLIQLIGVGSVGLQILRMLVAMTFDRIEIFDDDKVDATNVHTQCYPHSMIGKPKVLAAIDTVKDLFVPTRFTSIDPYELRLPDDTISIYPKSVVFLCVDSMLARTNIFESCEPALIIDTRCAAESVHVLTCTNTRGARRFYRSTLFTDAEASPEPCGYRSTIYNATLAASLAIHQLTRYLRDIPLDQSTTYHQTGSIFIAEPMPDHPD
jgi:sulfur carrier protein ThiS adenylyltransferase